MFFLGGGGRIFLGVGVVGGGFQVPLPPPLHVLSHIMVNPEETETSRSYVHVVNFIHLFHWSFKVRLLGLFKSSCLSVLCSLLVICVVMCVCVCVYLLVYSQLIKS